MESKLDALLALLATREASAVVTAPVAPVAAPVEGVDMSFPAQAVNAGASDKDAWIAAANPRAWRYDASGDLIAVRESDIAATQASGKAIDVMARSNGTVKTIAVARLVKTVTTRGGVRVGIFHKA